jgi:hypothetical protein
MTSGLRETEILKVLAFDLFNCWCKFLDNGVGLTNDHLNQREEGFIFFVYFVCMEKVL